MIALQYFLDTYVSILFAFFSLSNFFVSYIFLLKDLNETTNAPTNGGAIAVSFH